MSDGTVLEMFVVYAHPRDYPTKFVVRRWGIGAGISVPDDDWFYLGDSLDEVRAHVPPHCVRLERDSKDEPQIVECWL